MALSLSISQASGISVTYWIITEVRINVLHEFAIVGIAGYLDKAAFDSGKDPIVTDNVNIPTPAYLQMIGNLSLLSPLETLLSQLPPLVGASVI